MWPDVFAQPLAAPYRPDVTDDHKRRAAAIADGLDAWRLCHVGRSLGLTRPPLFGHVMVKLMEIAGMDDGSERAFVAAADEWMAEHGRSPTRH